MWCPKFREVKEAITAVFSPRFTTKFPAEPHQAPEKYRGKPEFDLDKCIGCGACVNVCPTQALTMEDDLDCDQPKRKITLRHDTCIFCGNCSENCTTEDGINLSRQWDLAGLDRQAMSETHEFEIQMCERCGAFVGPKKHLVWIYEKLGPLAYTNPSLILAKNAQLRTDSQQLDTTEKSQAKPPETRDFMRILCPKCKCELNIRL
ncbi:MAG: 4Fe-4S binding protein [Sedimentisphaerales bacterium]|nr:4Fe-4S binding protein [Sedimentisphaerales bacterium]